MQSLLAIASKVIKIKIVYFTKSKKKKKQISQRILQTTQYITFLVTYLPPSQKYKKITYIYCYFKHLFQRVYEFCND